MKGLKYFWSLYSVNLVRFWTNQLVMSILGISIGLATIALDNLTVAIFGCVFSIGLLCFLQYDNTFQLGEKHHYRPADALRPKKTLGLKIALWASVPLFLIILLGFILDILFQSDSASVVCKLIYYAVHGSYTQLHALLTSLEILSNGSLSARFLGWCLCLAYTAPAILFSTLGYILGSKDRPLRSLLGFKTSANKKGK